MDVEEGQVLIILVKFDGRLPSAVPRERNVGAFVELFRQFAVERIPRATLRVLSNVSGFRAPRRTHSGLLT